MKVTGGIRPNPDLLSLLSHAETDEAAAYARAEQTMRHGQRLVIGGFVVAMLGIVAYCIVSLRAAVNPELGSTAVESPGWLAVPALGIIGLGLLLWFVGCFTYLNGMMDSDPTEPDPSRPR